MRTSLTTISLLGLFALVDLAGAGEGQGPVDPGPITIEKLRLGTYWFGAQIDANDLKGKVVLVETWGS